MGAENLIRRRIAWIYAMTAAGILLWLGAIVGAPWLWSRGLRGAGFLYACFAPVCHQIPERSFFISGFPMAVCARCFGIYAGFAGGLILYPFRRGFSRLRLPPLKALILVSAPIVLDTAANFLKIWDTRDVLRFLSGILWGTILPFYFITGLGELFALRSIQKAARSESDSDSSETREIPQ